MSEVHSEHMSVDYIYGNEDAWRRNINEVDSFTLDDSWWKSREDHPWENIVYQSKFKRRLDVMAVDPSGRGYFRTFGNWHVEITGLTDAEVLKLRKFMLDISVENKAERDARETPCK